MFKVITAVATEPVTLVEARLHLRLDLIGSTHPDDDLVTALITAAREYAESYTNRALAPQTLEMVLDCFPAGNIDLDLSPVSSVTSIKYTDVDGVEQTVSTSDYSLSAYGLANTVSLAYDTVWPVTRAVRDAVRIRYVTGHTTVPKAVKAAILILIAHLYENRDLVNIGRTVTDVPLSAHALLDTERIQRFA